MKKVRLLVVFCFLLAISPFFEKRVYSETASNPDYNENLQVLFEKENKFRVKQAEKNKEILSNLQRFNSDITEEDLNNSLVLISKIVDNNPQLQEYASSVKRDLILRHQNDNEFKVALEQDPVNTMRVIDNLVANRLYREIVLESLDDVTLYSSNGVSAWVVADLVMQKNNYFCGPASALMAIDGMGKYVSGNTAYEKQETLARSFAHYPTSGEGSYVYDVRNCLNRYLKPGSAYYSYHDVPGNSITESQFTKACYESLDAGMAPLLHARTQYLPYYYGHSTGHYITVTGIDKNSGMVRLNDPNRNSSYHGVHRVTISAAHQSIKPSRRYLISGCL